MSSPVIIARNVNTWIAPFPISNSSIGHSAISYFTLTSPHSERWSRINPQDFHPASCMLRPRFLEVGTWILGLSHTPPTCCESKKNPTTWRPVIELFFDEDFRIFDGRVLSFKCRVRSARKQFLPPPTQRPRLNILFLELLVGDWQTRFFLLLVFWLDFPLRTFTSFENPDSTGPI